VLRTSEVGLGSGLGEDAVAEPAVEPLSLRSCTGLEVNGPGALQMASAACPVKLAFSSMRKIVAWPVIIGNRSAVRLPRRRTPIDEEARPVAHDSRSPAARQLDWRTDRAVPGVPLLLESRR